MITQAADSQIVFLIDDDDSLRKAIARLLRTAGFTVSEYGSAAEFLMGRDEEQRGCLLLDVRMPGPSGLELHKNLSRHGECLPVIFLTGHGDIPMSVQAIKDGAFDFLTKPVMNETLISTIEAALAKETASWHARRRTTDLKNRLKSLTPSELQICRMVVAGMPNKQIADEAHISERTVKSHRAHVMGKMGAVSVAELVRLWEELNRQPMAVF